MATTCWNFTYFNQIFIVKIIIILYVQVWGLLEVAESDENYGNCGCTFLGHPVVKLNHALGSKWSAQAVTLPRKYLKHVFAVLFAVTISEQTLVLNINHYI